VASPTRSVLSGAAWNYAGAAVLIVAQVLSTAATARLVSPREFGVYATAQAAAGIFGYFTFSAVGQGLLRRPHLGPRAVGTAMAISLTSGGVVALVMWFTAGAWSDAWHVPDAKSIVRVFALTLFLTSCATVPLALLRRSLRFQAAALVETGTQVVGITAGVLLAVQMHSAMALAIGQTIAAGAVLASASVLTRRELRLDFEGFEASDLFSFAGQVGAQNIGFFTLYTAPSWVIARLFGAKALGFYSRANLIVGLPLNYLTTGLIKVMYPFYGRVGTQVLRARALLSEAVTISTGFSWTFFALVAGASPVIVDVLLGPRWHASATLVRLCALTACANLPWVLLANAAEAFRWMRVVWSVQAAYALVLGTSIAVVHLASLGVNDILLGAAAAQWTGYLFLVRAFALRGLLDVRMITIGHMIHGAIAVGAFAAAAGCARLLHGEPLLVQTMAEFGVALAAGGILLAGRLWIPCSRLLGQRLAVATNDNSRLLARLGFSALDPSLGETTR
jgi:O-antigen/teichoic acid export membrane protein